MACGGKVLAAVVALFLVLVAQQLLAFTVQEIALINSVCNQTEPAYHLGCNSCLKMWYAMIEAPTYHADLKGVGSRSIYCARHATTVAVEVNQAETPPDGDPRNDNYIYCRQKVEDADVQLQHANVSCENGRYADAANQAQLAFNFYRDCIDRINNLKGYANVRGTVNTALEVGGAAVEVLKQVH